MPKNKKQKTHRIKRTTKRSLKRFYKQLQYYSPIIGIVSIILSVSFFTINYLGNQFSQRLAESWRDALSRSMEDIQRGGKAHPIRTPDKWAVEYERELSANLNIHLQAQVSALLFRNGSDSELERGEGYFEIDLTGTKEPLTYFDVLRIIVEGSQVQAKLRLLNFTNTARLDFLQIQFENDESSKILINKGNVTIGEGSFHSIPANTMAHLIVSQHVNTLNESSLLAVEISFSPEDWGSKILYIQIRNTEVTSKIYRSSRYLQI